MDILEIIGVPYFKKGKGIHIKKKNRGKFTEYCGGKVTDECIQRAKKSKNPKLRKRATFAANARKWKHAEGGLLKKFGGGGPVDEGGYDPKTRGRREWAYGMFDPSGGFGFSGLYGRSQNGGAQGEEDQYYRAYLGLSNSIPKMNPKAKTSWDDQIESEKVANGEQPSDFYGTTPRMDLNIQSIADTLNTGEMVRNYDKYKQMNPDLPSKRRLEEMYETGKRILDNPGTWQQVDGDRLGVKQKLDRTTNEMNPLGMLANFGMMWKPEEGALYMHDTYDFPAIPRALVGNRPKEMKIRGRISFDPKKGSKLLRDNMKGFNDYPEAIR